MFVLILIIYLWRTAKSTEWGERSAISQPSVHIRRTGGDNQQLPASARWRRVWHGLWRLLGGWYPGGSQAEVSIFQSRCQRVLDGGNAWSSVNQLPIFAANFGRHVTNLSCPLSGTKLNRDSSQESSQPDWLLQGWGVPGPCIWVYVRRRPPT